MFPRLLKAFSDQHRAGRREGRELPHGIRSPRCISPAGPGCSGGDCETGKARNPPGPHRRQVDRSMGCAFGGLGTGPLPDPDWRSDSVTRGRSWCTADLGKRVLTSTRTSGDRSVTRPRLALRLGHPRTEAVYRRSWQARPDIDANGLAAVQRHRAKCHTDGHGGCASGASSVLSVSQFATASQRNCTGCGPLSDFQRRSHLFHAQR